MNNNKKNQYLEMFLNIADELLENHHIKSRRDFSSRYLNKCTNYIASLVYRNKEPSISSYLKAKYSTMSMVYCTVLIIVSNLLLI